MDRIITRRQFILGGSAALASLYFLEACGQNAADFDFLKEKKQGVLDQQETLRVAKALQKGPGETIRNNGFWLESLTIGQTTLKEQSEYFSEQITAISISQTERVLGGRTLAVTGLTPDFEKQTIAVDITLHPIVLEGSDQAVRFLIGKELQNIKAAAKSAKEHQNLAQVDSESNFWRLITEEQFSQRHEIAAVLIDGRAYWETLDDFRQVGSSLASSYDSLKTQDRRIMDSHHKLASFAVANNLMVEENGHWIQNPELPHPGYTNKAWVNYLLSLYEQAT